MIVGIDIGTQSLKAVVTDARLNVMGEAAIQYRPSFPGPDRAEQHATVWERALGPAIAAALRQADVPPDRIAALGLCGQLDGCVAVDSSGVALGPCLIWMDRRAQAEAAEVPADLIRARSGVVRDPSHMAAKIVWLRRHHAPAAGAVRFHQPVSYMVERLTGAAVMDHALASTSMLYALQRRSFDPELLDRFGIDASLLPELAEAQARAGALSRVGAELAGLPVGIPVAVGTGDDFSTPLGAGLIAPGTIQVAVGTGEVIGAIADRPIIDEAGLVETNAYPGGRWFLKTPGWLSGGAVVWLTDLLGMQTVQAFDAAAEAVKAGADGLLFLPALTGAMAPEWHAGARGCFYGLTPSHGRGHMARALLEGCAFAMRDVADRLRALGVETQDVLLLGGGARSRIWTQMRVDVLGLPGRVPARVDTSPLGAAMLAAVAAEILPDLIAAADLVRAEPAALLNPNPQDAEAYAQAYAGYRRLFDALRPMFGPDGDAG
jgi:xylulokinase